MGLAVHVILSGKIIEQPKEYVNTKALAGMWPDLDLIATELNLVPLSNFLHVTPQDVEDAKRFGLPAPALRQDFIQPEIGLRTVRGLIDHLSKKKKRKNDTTQDVLAGLKWIESRLNVAEKQNVKFYLSIG